MAVYYALLTNNGLAKIAEQPIGGQLSITHFAVGDSNGAYYEPSATATALVHETWRSTVNRVYVHPNNANWIVIEALIPATVGGFDIREAGVFASDGSMVAIGKYPLTNKPAVGSGSEKDLYVRMILQVSNSATISQTIDNSLVMATQAYVDQRVPHPVRVATTGNITLSGLVAVDGVTLVLDDRVLVNAQTTGSQNGIYLAKSTAWVRATDFDNSLESTDGVLIVVAQGTLHADTVWLLTTPAPITLGTTALTFTKIIPDESSRTIIDSSVPTGDTGSIKTLFSCLGYMIKSITGKSNWRTVPATTLETANTHHGRVDNPHATTAAQVGASAANHLHTGTYEPANANIQSHISATAPHSGHVSHSLATAANDFLVASGVGAFVKKTLAEVKAILGLGGAAYLNTGITNGTVATGDHGHANTANIGGPYSLSTHLHTGTYEPANANIQAHIAASAPHAGHAAVSHTHDAASLVSGVIPVDRSIVGSLVGFASANTSAVVTISGIIPEDDTIPQNTEGTQCLAVVYAAKRSNSKLRILFSGNIVSSGDSVQVAAIFASTSANAISVSHTFAAPGTRAIRMEAKAEYSPGTTGNITYTVRMGRTDGGGFTLNGAGATRIFGGASVAYLTVEEIAQ